MIAGQKTEIRSKLSSDLDTDAQGYQNYKTPTFLRPINHSLKNEFTLPVLVQIGLV